MKIILVDPYLVSTFLVIICFFLNMVRTLENNYFLMRTKLGHLREHYTAVTLAEVPFVLVNANARNTIAHLQCFTTPHVTSH